MKNKIFFIGLTIGILLMVAINKMDEEKNIVIGVVLPLSGGAAQYGKWIQNSLNMAKDEINLKNKRKIKYIFEDDKANPKDAINAINKLISNDKTKIIFGSWASSSVMAMAPIAEKNKVLLFAEALSPNITHAGEYIYRVQPDGSLYMNKLIQYLRKKQAKNIGVIYINNEFGIEQMKLLEENMNISYKKAYAGKTNDFKSIIENIKNLNIKNILILGYKETAYFYKQLYELGINNDISLFGSVPTENPEIIKIAGVNATNGIVYPHHFKGIDSIKTKQEKDFFENYKNRYGYYPEGFAYLAYEAMKFIIYPSIINTSIQGIDTDKIKQYLDRTTFMGLSSSIKFDKFGDVQREIYLKEIQNEKFILLEKNESNN